jgi:hypothetical protein
MPRKYSLNTVLTTLRAHHGLISLTADALGCTRATVYNYVTAYPEVAAVVTEERERLVDMAEDALYFHLEQKAPWAIALVLKTLGKSRGYVEKVVADDTPIDIEQVIQASSEWQEILTTLLRTLDAYPDARWAVVQALQPRHAHESTNGHTAGA